MEQTEANEPERTTEDQRVKPHPFYEPEYRALHETLVEYERAAAEERIYGQIERQKRDAVIACWRDVLHSLLKQVGPIDPAGVHKVIDAMDNFLNRAGGRRK